MGLTPGRMSPPISKKATSDDDLVNTGPQTLVLMARTILTPVVPSRLVATIQTSHATTIPGPPIHMAVAPSLLGATVTSRLTPTSPTTTLLAPSLLETTVTSHVTPTTQTSQATTVLVPPTPMTVAPNLLGATVTSRVTPTSPTTMVPAPSLLEATVTSHVTPTTQTRQATTVRELLTHMEVEPSHLAAMAQISRASMVRALPIPIAVAPILATRTEGWVSSRTCSQSI